MSQYNQYQQTGSSSNHQMQLSEDDCYEIYGLIKGQNYGFEELRNKFKKLAIKYHPDKNKKPQNRIIFQHIQDAYVYLHDKKKNLEYEQKDHQTLVDQFNSDKESYFTKPPQQQQQNYDIACNKDTLANNNDKFNQFFQNVYQEQHIPNTQGYGDLMDNTDENFEPQKDPNINKSNFNSEFLQRATNARQKNKSQRQNQLIPQESQNQVEKGLILGQGTISDFSMYHGKTKGYDYLLAFDVPDIDYTQVNSNKPITSLEQIKKQRATMDPRVQVFQKDELSQEHARQQLHQEQLRQLNLRNQALQTEQRYSMIQNLIR